jgi:hypothetical protein
VRDAPPLPTGARPVADPRDPRRTLPGYAVRADGTVLWYDRRRGLWIPSKPKIGPGRFHKVRLRIGRKIREIGLAHLVLRAFVGPRPIAHEPLHYPDPDPGNNSVENLRWAVRGASKVGRQLGPTIPPAPRGETHPFAVLTEGDVVEIRALYRAGVGYKEVAEKLGTSAECVRHVLIGETWAHVPDTLGPVVMRGKGCRNSEDGPLARLDWEKVAEIRAQIEAGVPRLEVARRFEVSKGCIQDILKGRTWRTPPDD